MDNKKIIYCTYFDKNYLVKGLAMYTSLKRFNPQAYLGILCMDSYTQKMVEKMKLKDVKILTLGEFEDSKLLQAKKNRSKIEYYWTCTPSLPLYILTQVENCNLVIYLDADLYFFSPIDSILNKLGDKSIFVVEHKFAKHQQFREDISGRFNVGILGFRKDRQGLACLTRWRKQCIDWCYFREEDGKMGDQLYLNEWPKLYNNIVILKNLGVNTAPWNVGQYRVSKINGSIYVNSDKLICYHFHQFKIIDSNKFLLAKGYRLSPQVKKYIYEPYKVEIKRQLWLIRQLDPSYRSKTSRLDIFSYYVSRILS